MIRMRIVEETKDYQVFISIECINKASHHAPAAVSVWRAVRPSSPGKTEDSRGGGQVKEGPNYKTHTYRCTACGNKVT